MAVGWTHSTIGVVRKALARRMRAGHRRAARLARRGLVFPNVRVRRRQQGEVWVIMMVKNEADIIEACIRHAFAQGVNRLVVADNGSSDGTLAILEALATTFPIFIAHDREPAYVQSEKMTRIARWASRRGADWIVPIDADEFWFAEDTSVAEFLRVSAADMIDATIRNFFPTELNPSPHGLHGPLRYDAHRDDRLVKAAGRGHPLIWIGMGNHTVLRPGRVGDGLFVAHLPWRNEQQFTKKIREGAQALALAPNLPDRMGNHWRVQAALDDDGLHDAWLHVLSGIGDESLGWSPRGPFTILNPSDWSRWPAEKTTQRNPNPTDRQ